MVLLSSRLGLFAAAPERSGRKDLHLPEHPFYRRYGVKLPSSLTRDHSSTLACSASLPVSVCGTVTIRPPEQAFLDGTESAPLRVYCYAPSHSPLGHRIAD